MANSDKTTYISNALYRIGKSGRWGNIVVIDDVIKKHKAGEYVSQTDLQKMKLASDAAYDSLSGEVKSSDRKFDSDLAQGIYKLGKEAAKTGIPFSQNIGEKWMDATDAIFQSDANTRAARMAWISKVQPNNFLEQGRETATKTLTDFYDLALADENLRIVFDAVFGQEFKANLTDDAHNILQSNPDFNDSLKLSNLIDDTGNLKTDVSELKNLLKDKLDSTLNEITKAQSEAALQINSIAEQTAQVGRTPDEVSEILTTLKKDAEARSRQIVNEWDDYSLRSITSVVSLLIEDKKVGRQITAVVNAYIESKNLLNQFNSVSSASSAMGGIGAMGTLGLVGGYVGIAIALYSAFSESEQQSADELILEGLQKLSQQIEEFRKEVMDGLMVIDKKLSWFIEQTSISFQRIFQRFDDIDIDLERVKESLCNISIQINQMWMDIDRKLDYLIKQDLEDTQIEIFNYKDDLGEMNADELEDYFKEIRKLFDKSKDVVFAGNTESLSHADTLHTEIINKTAADSINILRKYADQVLDTRLSEKKRGNPNRVNLCADMLVTLIREHPNAFSGFLSSGGSIKLIKDIHSEIRKNKQEVEQFLVGNEKKSVSVLFEKLLTDYSEAIEDLVKESRRIRKQELINFNEITNEVPEGDIVNILEVFSDLINRGFRLDEWNVNVCVFNEKAIRKLTSMPFKHANEDAWTEFHDWIIDPQLLNIEQFRHFKGYKGNVVDFPNLFLPHKSSKSILKEFPLLSIGIGLGLVQGDFEYFATLNPFLISTYFNIPSGWSSDNRCLSGRACVTFRVNFTLGNNSYDLATPRLRDPLDLYYWYGAYFGRILSAELKTVVSNAGLWDTNENFPHLFTQEQQSAYHDLGEEIFYLIKKYTNQVQFRLLEDLRNSSTDLYKCVQKIETQSKLIKLFCEYLFRHTINLQTDNLSYLMGDLQTEFNGQDSFYNPLPLLGFEKIIDIVESYKFPEIDDDPFDASRANDFVNLQFLDQGLREETKETTMAIAQEVVKIVSIWNENNLTNQYLTSNYIALEMLLASIEE